MTTKPKLFPQISKVASIRAKRTLHHAKLYVTYFRELAEVNDRSYDDAHDLIARAEVWVVRDHTLLFSKGPHPRMQFHWCDECPEYRGGSFAERLEATCNV